MAHVTVGRSPEIAVNLGMGIAGCVIAIDLVQEARYLDVISAISSRSRSDLGSFGVSGGM